MKHFIFANDRRVFVIRIKMIHCKRAAGGLETRIEVLVEIAGSLPDVIMSVIFESRSLRAMSEFDRNISNVLRG